MGTHTVKEMRQPQKGRVLEETECERVRCDTDTVRRVKGNRAMECLS